MTAVTVKAVGRRYTRTWPDGTERTGYDVLVVRDGGARVDAFVADTGNRGGWIVADAETGECIFGLGSSTKVGNGRADALWSWERALNGHGPQSARISGEEPS